MAFAINEVLKDLGLDAAEEADVASLIRANPSFNSHADIAITIERLKKLSFRSTCSTFGVLLDFPQKT